MDSMIDKIRAAEKQAEDIRAQAAADARDMAARAREEAAERLAAAAEACWAAILRRDLMGFAAAYKASFEAQVALFPGMINPSFPDGRRVGEDRSAATLGLAPAVADDGFLPTVQAYIDKYSAMPGVLAWKMPGAGGGGYLALVCTSPDAFPEGAIPLTIRRPGM